MCGILCHTLRAWEPGVDTEACELKPDAVGVEPDPEPTTFSPHAYLIPTTKHRFPLQTQTMANCPDFVQVVILDNIRGTMRAKTEKEHAVQQEHGRGYIRKNVLCI